MPAAVEAANKSNSQQSSSILCQQLRAQNTNQPTHCQFACKYNNPIPFRIRGMWVFCVRAGLCQSVRELIRNYSHFVRHICGAAAIFFQGLQIVSPEEALLDAGHQQNVGESAAIAARRARRAPVASAAAVRLSHPAHDGGQRQHRGDDDDDGR